MWNRAHLGNACELDCYIGPREAITSQITGVGPGRVSRRRESGAMLRFGAFVATVRGLFTRRIAGKIILPYFLLVCILVMVLATIAVNLVTGSLEEKFRAELAGAGRSANEAMVLLEGQNLSVLRQMIFTEGVDTAVATADTASLQELLAPIAANSRVAYVDVFMADGAPVLAFRPGSFTSSAPSLIDPNASEWGPVRLSLDGLTDEFGDKHAAFVDVPWGRLFVSASPVWIDQRVVGVIAVGVPIEEVTKRLSQEAGSKGITLYTMDGAPIASTIRASSATLEKALQLSTDKRDDILNGKQVVVRRSAVGDVLYVEVLGVLAVRHESLLILGAGDLINIIEEQGALTRQIMIAVACAALLIVLAIGIYIARRITTRSINPLVEATQHVRRNELDFEVPVQSEDELGILAATFNEMRGGLKERERSRDAIQRYMSPKVYDLIQRGELKMGGVSREITVFKTDIRDFTSLSEKMQPEALVDFLNRYFENIVAPISKYDGEVDKYMGDAVLAKFGATEWYPDHARRAVLAMIEMIEACERMNYELRREGQPPVRMGIGVNTGEAVVGNIGAAARMEYTIISDAVNTAQRIEELCKEFGWDLLMSDRTYEQARDAVEVGEPWSIRLRGHTRDTLVYPILGRKGAVSPDRRRAYDALAEARVRAARAALSR